MVAFSYTAGMTIASRFAPGISGSDERCAITGGAQCREIPEQTQHAETARICDWKKSNSRSAGKDALASA
ncbi:hypothetical protein QD47_27730 [Paenibacillus terrae]|uniref:Uncharacterized protein n=1 Tax=Paenibacillus terrae TaxID=159743 RepID=A0A0D7WTM2_9BACL|nr:hypothetical protein QD47_27730 [Paenibacillus terrae]